jgi:hypothetical protein
MEEIQEQTGEMAEARDLIRKQINEGNVDPRDIARHILMHNLSRAQRVALARVALTGMAREELGKQHRSVMSPPSAPPKTYETPAGTFVSAKVAARRAAGDSWRERALRIAVHCGPGYWKPLGQCSVDDLAFAAREREELAVSNTREAEKFRALAKLVEHAGVNSVSELDDDALATVVRSDEDES